MSGDHAVFIWAAYAVAGLAVAALALRAALDHRAQLRALARLGGTDRDGRRHG